MINSFLAVLIFTFCLALSGKAHALNYETAASCSTDQLSLERNWNSYIVGPSDAPVTEHELPPVCTLFAMQSFESWARSRPVYAQCTDENSQAVRARTAPCKTQFLVENLTRLYNRFSRCLEIPAKFFFLVISSESGFFLNAFAPGLDVGLGQLTPDGITDVNMNWNQLTQPLRDSSSPFCRELKNWIDDLHVADEDILTSCQFIVTPENPARNLTYSLLLFNQNRNYYRNLFADLQVQSELTSLLKRRLSVEETSQLIDSFSLLTYNMGFVRFSTLFREFLNLRMAPIRELQSQIEATRVRIIGLQSRLPELNRQARFDEVEALRWEISLAQNLYRIQFAQLRQPQVEFAHLDPLISGPSSFQQFLRQQGESHYLDLILSRAEIADRTLGAGYCTQTRTQDLLSDIPISTL